MNPKDIAVAYAERAGLLEGIRAALHYEPVQLPELPCVTMLFAQVQQDDVETGPATENHWRWNVYLYIPLGNTVAGDAYEAAQDALYELVPRLLSITRTDPDLGGLAIISTISDLGSEPEFDEENGALVKTLRLDVRANER